MSRQIICTVGTSLLTNRDDRPWAGWNPRGSDPRPSLDDVGQWLATADPVKASAETNTLRALELGEADTLCLLHSDTPEGRFCAEALHGFYEPLCRHVTIERIGKLGYGAAVFTTGLKALVDVTLKLVEDARKVKREPILCATGGFKAEIAFLNLIGALLGIEVVYIHEQHRALVRLPRLPLTWDDGFVLQHADFFNWIDAEPRTTHDVESWLKARSELRSLVEDDGKGCTFLTAAGDLLFKVARARSGAGPRAVWPETDPRPPAEKKMVQKSNTHHRPDGWEPFVNKLCGIDCVTQVHAEPSAVGGPRVKVIDANAGSFGVRFNDGKKDLQLRVETTAHGEAQCELVAAHLRTLLR